MSLGKRIKECRSLRKLTLQEVGDQFGINRSSVSDWERDKTRPDLDRLVSLARILGTTTDYLLVGKKSSATTWPFTVSQDLFNALDSTAQAEIDTMISGLIELRYVQRPKQKTGS